MSRGSTELALCLVESLFMPNRTIELSPFMDLRMVEDLATMTLEAVDEAVGGDGLQAALLRRLIADCQAMSRPKYQQRIRR